MITPDLLEGTKRLKCVNSVIFSEIKMLANPVIEFLLSIYVILFLFVYFVTRHAFPFFFLILWSLQFLS